LVAAAAAGCAGWTRLVVRYLWQGGIGRLESAVLAARFCGAV
jgi:hypothetical protein